MRDFGIGIDWAGDAVHLRVRGELDLAVADRLVEGVVAVKGSSARAALVDLHEVTFIDSSGLRALLAVQRLGESDGGFAVVLVRASAPVRDVIGLTGVAELLRLAPDAETALASLA